MNARAPLAAAIVAVLGAGVALAVIRPGDLATDEPTLAQGPTTSTTTSPSTTTTGRPPAEAPGVEPGTGPGAGSPPETTGTTATTRPAPAPTPPEPTTTAPTTTAPPTPPASTAPPGDAGPPQLARTGDPPLGAGLGLALVVAAGVARWASTREARPPD